MEEENKTVQNAESERSWGEATIDVISNMADAYIKTGRLLPSLVAGIPAALNTESFQEQKNKLAFDAWRRQQMQKNAEQENILFQQSQEDRPIHRQMLEQKAQNNALLLQQRQIHTDNLYYTDGLKRAKQEALERFRENPAYGMLNSDEKNRFDNSVQMQKLAEFVFFGNEFQEAWNLKDQSRIERLQRMAAKDGLKFSQNEKGDYILSGNGFNVVIDDKNRGAIGNYLAKNAANEFNAIFETSQKSTYARADKKIHAAYANALVENSIDTSLGNNLKLVKDTIQAMPQSWKNTMLLRRICDDLLSSDYDDIEKQQEAMMALSSSSDALSLLEQEGFRLEPGAMGFADARFYDAKTKRVYNINELHDILVERDKGTDHLDKLVQQKKYAKQAAIAATKRKQELEAIRILNTQAQMSKQGKGNTAGQKGAETGEVPAPTVSRNNTMALIDWFGEDLRGKSNDVFLNLQKAVNETRANSVQRGFGEQDANGNFRVSAKFTDDDLTHAKAIEKQAFKKYGMEDYAEKGFWHSVAAQVEAEKELNNSHKREKKIKQMDENIKNASRAAQSSNPLVQLGANDMAGSMMTTRALLGLFNKSKTDNASKKKESAQKRITAAGKIEPEKKKK